MQCRRFFSRAALVIVHMYFYKNVNYLIINILIIYDVIKIMIIERRINLREITTLKLVE